MRASWRVLLLAVVSCLGLLLNLERSAHAAPLDADTTAAGCPRGNLLAHATALAGDLPAARLALLTNGVLAREGAPWPSEQVIVVIPGQLSFDLGRAIGLEQLYLQVDADQAFVLELSADGTDWTRLPVSASATTSGLVFRSFKLNGAAARFVKLRATSEPQTLTLAEVGVVCQHEAKLRQRLALDESPRHDWRESWTARVTQRLTGALAVSPEATNVVKLLLVVLSVLLILNELRRRGSTPALVWALLAAAPSALTSTSGRIAIRSSCTITMCFTTSSAPNISPSSATETACSR